MKSAIPSSTEPAVMDSLRALAATFASAVTDSAEAGAEALDLPRMACDALVRWIDAGAWDEPLPPRVDGEAEPRAVRRVELLKYWGDCMEAEPRRPGALPYASDAVKRSSIHMLAASRAVASLAFTVAPLPASDGTLALIVRTTLGELVAAYVARGWDETIAWELVQRRYVAGGGAVPL